MIAHNPVLIDFGISLEQALLKIKEEEKEKIVFLTSPSFAKQTEWAKNILGQRLKNVLTNMAPNPDFNSLLRLRQQLGHFDAIVALGGGSVMDAAKFLSLEEVVLNHHQLFTDFSKAKSIYAIPTTHGSSSELTSWASIWHVENQQKYSLSSSFLFPKCAFYVPELTLTLPLQMSLFSSLDSLSHALESLWNKNENFISTHYALAALTIFLAHLPNLPQQLDNLNWRTKMLEGSIFAGLAFSNTQTALAHALSYPLTLKWRIPHGLAVAFSLPALFSSLPDGKINHLLKPFLPKLNALFDNLNLKKEFHFLKEKDIHNLFLNLNERAQNSIFDLEKVRHNLIQFYFK